MLAAYVTAPGRSTIADARTFRQGSATVMATFSMRSMFAAALAWKMPMAMAFAMTMERMSASGHTMNVGFAMARGRFMIAGAQAFLWGIVIAMERRMRMEMESVTRWTIVWAQ